MPEVPGAVVVREVSSLHAERQSKNYAPYAISRADVRWEGGESAELPNARSLYEVPGASKLYDRKGCHTSYVVKWHNPQRFCLKRSVSAWQSLNKQKQQRHFWRKRELRE